MRSQPAFPFLAGRDAVDEGAPGASRDEEWVAGDRRPDGRARGNQRVRVVDPRLIEQPKKLATPFTTTRLLPLVQVSVPPAGLVPMLSVTTVALSIVTIWFTEFWTETLGCWLQIAPAGPPPGWTWNARWLTVVPTMNAALVAGVRNGLLLATRVYALAEAKLIEQPKNVAMPLTTTRLRPLVHDRVPPAGFVPIGASRSS